MLSCAADQILCGEAVPQRRGWYIGAYTSYAPYYTILCLVIFCCFNLYSGIWKYAGFNDLNRIVGANVVCFIVHIIGTLILLRERPL